MNHGCSSVLDDEEEAANRCLNHVSKTSRLIPVELCSPNALSCLTRCARFIFYGDAAPPAASP